MSTSNFVTQLEAALSVASSSASPAAQDALAKGKAFAEALEVWAPELAEDGINAAIDAFVPALIKPEVNAAVDFAINSGFKFAGNYLDPLIDKVMGGAMTRVVAVTTTGTGAAPG